MANIRFESTINVLAYSMVPNLRPDKRI